MRQIRAWLLRLGGVFARDRRTRDFDDELSAHLEMHVADNLRAGMTPDEARRRALLALGGVEPVREAYRDRAGIPLLDSLTQDVRFALRILRRTPGISAFAVLAIALGIGINTTVFSLANAVLFKVVPFDEDGRLAFIGTTNPERGGELDPVSWPDFQDLKARVRSIENLAMVASTAADISDDAGYAEPLRGVAVSPNVFSITHTRAIAGRLLTEADSTPGAPRVAMLTESVWRTRYGADPAMVNRTVRINAEPVTIVGVSPDIGVGGDGNTGVYLPFVLERRWEDRSWRHLTIFGRLAPDATFETAAAEVAAISSALATEHPKTNARAAMVARDFRSFSLPPQVRMLFLVMIGAVGFVLLVACANVANLLLARAAGRSREIAIRAAIGASRARVVRQLLVESVLLAMAGGVLGLLLAIWGVRTFDAAVASTGKPVWLDFSVDFTVLVYLSAITMGTGILFGLAPAWRLSKVDTTAALKDGAAGSGRRRGRRLMATLVVAELTLAVVLLAGAGVMIRSFLNIYTVPLGFDKTSLLTMRLNTARYYAKAEERSVLFRRTLTQLGSVAGIDAAAVSTSEPAGGSITELPLETAPASALAETAIVAVMGDYAKALGLRLSAGHWFSDADAVSATSATVVVNETFAARAWPGENAVGRQIRLTRNRKPGVWQTVVGVMPDVAQRARDVHRPVVYLPYAQHPEASVTVVMGARSAPAALIGDVRRAMQSVDPNLPPIELDTFANRFNNEHWPSWVFGTLFTAFGSVALLLAALGLYGVTSHSVSQRTHEIGVRMALGATSRNVLREVVGGATRQVAVGLTLGLVAAAGLTRLLASQLVDVSPNDPLTFAAVITVLVLVGLLGCALPARRALRVNPVTALRHE